MNPLDLPARRPLAPDVRDRIRQTVENGDGAAGEGSSRARAPMAVAAGVAVLALGAAIVTQSVTGAPADWRPGSAPPTSTTSGKPDVPRGPAIPPVTATQPDAGTTSDLDRCGAAVEASPRAHEFPPRSAWVPVFTATAQDGTRITAFREYGGKPGFCEVTATTVTVSDPSAEPMSIASGAVGRTPVSVYALYVSPSGMVAGVAQGVSSLEVSVYRDGKVHDAMPAFTDDLFVVQVGELSAGDGIDVVGRDDDGGPVGNGMLAYDPDNVRPVGATGPV